MRFDLTDLRLFLNIYEAGTITGGASRSHMTLASASERIKGMESALGIALLVRKRRGVQLTPAGRTLMHHAHVVLQQMDRLRGELNHYGKGLKGHVRLLCNTSALSEHLPDILGDFLVNHPRISIDIEERLSYEIADAIRMGMADMGIVADSANLQGLETYHFRPDPLALIVSKQHPLARQTSASLEDIVDLDFVGLIEGSALQEHITFHARQIGKLLNYRVRLRSITAICRMVGLGIGVAVVPENAARRHARTSGIKRLALTDAWATRDLLLCVRAKSALPAYAIQMMDHILAPTPSRSS